MNIIQIIFCIAFLPIIAMTFFILVITCIEAWEDFKTYYKDDEE